MVAGKNYKVTIPDLNKVDRCKSWTSEKLKNPRQFREGIRMPEFSFTKEELEALVLFAGKLQGKDTTG